jgi:hypothetical protein
VLPAPATSERPFRCLLSWSTQDQVGIELVVVRPGEQQPATAACLQRLPALPLGLDGVHAPLADSGSGANIINDTTLSALTQLLLLSWPERTEADVQTLLFQTRTTLSTATGVRGDYPSSAPGIFFIRVYGGSCNVLLPIKLSRFAGSSHAVILGTPTLSALQAVITLHCRSITLMGVQFTPQLQAAGVSVITVAVVGGGDDDRPASGVAPTAGHLIRQTPATAVNAYRGDGRPPPATRRPSSSEEAVSGGDEDDSEESEDARGQQRPTYTRRTARMTVGPTSRRQPPPPPPLATPATQQPPPRLVQFAADVPTASHLIRSPANRQPPPPPPSAVSTRPPGASSSRDGSGHGGDPRRTITRPQQHVRSSSSTLHATSSPLLPLPILPAPTDEEWRAFRQYVLRPGGPAAPSSATAAAATSRQAEAAAADADPPAEQQARPPLPAATGLPPAAAAAAAAAATAAPPEDIVAKIQSDVAQYNDQVLASYLAGERLPLAHAGPALDALSCVWVRRPPARARAITSSSAAAIRVYTIGHTQRRLQLSDLHYPAVRPSPLQPLFVASGLPTLAPQLVVGPRLLELLGNPPADPETGMVRLGGALVTFLDPAPDESKHTGGLQKKSWGKDGPPVASAVAAFCSDVCGWYNFPGLAMLNIDRAPTISNQLARLQPWVVEGQSLKINVNNQNALDTPYKTYSRGRHVLALPLEPSGFQPPGPPPSAPSAPTAPPLRWPTAADAATLAAASADAATSSVLSMAARPFLPTSSLPASATPITSVPPRQSSTPGDGKPAGGRQ